MISTAVKTLRPLTRNEVGSACSQWRTQKFSKEGASAAYFSNFTAWLMAIMLFTAVRNMQQKV
jgi:hypothetical protein